MSSSLSASWTCQECRRQRRGARHQTMTGRTICGPCARGLDAATLGLATGDTVGGQLGNAVGTDGIRGLLRRALGKRD